MNLAKWSSHSRVFCRATGEEIGLHRRTEEVTQPGAEQIAVLSCSPLCVHSLAMASW